MDDWKQALGEVQMRVHEPSLRRDAQESPQRPDLPPLPDDPGPGRERAPQGNLQDRRDAPGPETLTTCIACGSDETVTTCRTCGLRRVSGGSARSDQVGRGLATLACGLVAGVLTAMAITFAVRALGS